MLIRAILELIVTKHKHKKTSLDNLKLFSGWLLQGIGLCAKFTPVSLDVYTYKRGKSAPNSTPTLPNQITGTNFVPLSVF